MAKKVGTYLLLAVIGLFLIAPFIWMFLVSLHESKSPIPVIAEILPRVPKWENYKTVLLNQEVPVFRFILNSIIVCCCVVSLQLWICSMAAFAFSRLEFRGRNALFSLFLLTMMFSGTVTQIPVYLALRQAQWLDSYASLILPTASSAFGIFLLRQFFNQIPTEFDDAAKIDGASNWTVYLKVILPMSKAALATLGAFAFIGTWTDFFWPLISTSSLEMRTMEVGLDIFKNSYGGTNWPLQMTAAVAVLVPVIAVFLLLQRFFVKGVTMGGLK